MSVRLSISGIEVSIESENSSLLAYCSRFLRAFSSHSCDAKLDLEVYFSGNRRSRSETLDLPKILGAGVKVYGNSIEICAHQAAGVFCEVRNDRNDGHQVIYCHSEISRVRRLWRLIKGRKQSQNQLHMTMLRQGVLLPVLALLLSKQRLLALHASVVALNGRAIVFTGLNGCGKSGLALNLITQQEFLYLSDNYALIDPSIGLAYAFPEPIRITNAERLTASRRFSGNDLAFGKWQMVPNQEILCSQAEVSCVAHIAIGSKFTVRRMGSEQLATRLISLHRFLAETPEYSWIHLYHHLALQKDLGEIADSATHELCRTVPCYEIEIPWTKEPSERYREATQWAINQTLDRPNHL